MKKVLLPKSAPNYRHDANSGNVIIRPRDGLLKRLPVSVGRVSAFDELHEKLATATELFQNYGDSGKRGVKFALTDTIAYLTSRGIPPAALRPLDAVLAALIDADKGISSPIFTPVRTKDNGGKGRPALSIEEREFRDLQAVVTQCCVEHLRREGVNDYKKQGCALASRLIKASNWNRDISPDRLGKVRDQVNRSPARSIDRQFWNETLASDGYRIAPLEWAHQLLNSDLVNLPPKENP